MIPYAVEVRAQAPFISAEGTAVEQTKQPESRVLAVTIPQRLTGQVAREKSQPGPSHRRTEAVSVYGKAKECEMGAKRRRARGVAAQVTRWARRQSRDGTPGVLLVRLIGCPTD